MQVKQCLIVYRPEKFTCKLKNPLQEKVFKIKHLTQYKKDASCNPCGVVLRGGYIL